MKRGRPRQLNPYVPSHIDQAKLPADVYFDHRFAGGRWYMLSRVDGKRRRKDLANAKASLADLHRLAAERRDRNPAGTMDWLCSLFEESDKFKGLSRSTQDDYRYCRAILMQRKDKAGVPLGRWPIVAFTATVIQRLVDAIGKTHPSKANHLLRYLRRVFRWGGNRGYCLKVNPAAEIEPAQERKRRPIPPRPVMEALIQFARDRGAITTRTKGSMPPYLWAVAVIAYTCRLRGVEVVTLTDAHELPDGVHTNRRKGSRDNIVKWSPRLRDAWDFLVDRRNRIWSKKRIPTPLQAERRLLVVQEDGSPLARRVLGNAWKRLISAAIEEGKLDAGGAFGMHAFKRRGITDTKGTRGEKQQASGHKNAAMLDVYDFEIPLVKPAGA